MTEDKGYGEFIEQNPDLAQVVPESFWKYAVGCGEHTERTLGGEWYRNLKKNLRHLYPKYRSIPEMLGGIGKNKAVIGVGAGPSFNLNKKDLEFIYRQNVHFLLADQPFIIIATNHQYKPLLNMGIFPHFVCLIESGEHVYDQLCTDIPKLGDRSILLASLDANHRILKEWTDSGKELAFFLPGGEQNKKIFKKRIKENPEPLSIGTGGNVLNAVFSIAIWFLGSRIFMAVGNDLCFKADKDIENRRSNFYADGDYDCNIQSNRDEAKDRFTWMGIKWVESKVHPTGKVVDLEPVMTSRQFLTYKTWVEMHVGAWARQKLPFKYINCTEGGICGVVNTENNKAAFKDIKTWKLMDEICNDRWFTMTLLDAANEWMEFLEKCQILTGIKNGAGSVIGLPHLTGGAGLIDQHGRPITNRQSSGIIL